MRKISLSLIIIFIFFLLAVNAFAATYYVATTGSNSDPGTEAQPWLTLAYAESQLSSGDTVIVREGIYEEYFTIDVLNVTFQNHSGESPIIDGGHVDPVVDEYPTMVEIKADGVTVDGLTVRNSACYGIFIDGADNVTIKNVEVYETYRQSLVIMHDADNALIEDCEFHHGAKVAILWDQSISRQDPPTVTVKGSNGPIFRRTKIHDSYNEGIDIDVSTNNAIVECCEIYGNPKSQLYLCASTNNIIRYNLIYGTSNGSGQGIYVNHETQWVPLVGNPLVSNSKIYGNLIANTSDNVWIAGNTGRQVTNVQVYNNTLVEATGYGFRVESGTGGGHIFKNNIIWQTDGQIANIPSGKVTCDYNLWSRTPDADAQGANDPSYATPLLTKTSGWQAGAGLTGNDFTLQDSSSAINVGGDLGSPYNLGLNPTSTWPDSVSTLGQDSYGLWEIGGFVYTGTILPVVTTQAVADILTTTATGHGTITDVGGEDNCTKRGICWNTTGSPTVADDKVEFIGSFPAGAFSGNMTGLTPDQAYFASAYAYNTDGYGYGAPEGFGAAGEEGTYVIDNGDNGTSSTGAWSASGGANPYGQGSLYSHAVNATYTCEKTLDGNYTVSLWWTEYASRSSSVTVKIYDSGDNLLDTKSVDQTTLGGQWNTQDAYDFNATAKVTILSTGGGPPNVSTCADAVKFDYVEGSGGEDVNNPSILHGINLIGCKPN